MAGRTNGRSDKHCSWTNVRLDKCCWLDKRQSEKCQLYKSRSTDTILFIIHRMLTLYNVIEIFTSIII
jgi:hypothetical protein